MKRTLLLALLLPLAGAPAAFAADPVVTNVRFAQRTDGSRLVDVTYDLADADGDSCAVTLLASDDDGATWIMPCASCTGDAGGGVPPGANRHIVWDFGADNAGWEGRAYRLRVVACDQGVLFPGRSPARYAINDVTNIDWTVPGNFDKYARADLVILEAPLLWGYAPNEALHVTERIHAANPRCRILGYMLAKTSRTIWADPATPSTFGRAWFDRTRPYWAFTAEGDTVMDWPGQPVINILQPGCIDAMARTIAEYQRNSPNRLDGVAWDYFNTQLWIGPGVTMIGYPDLDGDGIAHWSDPDEIAAYGAAQVTLIEAVRDSLGDSFLQLFNGQRAYADSAFAARGDGMTYEAFPQVFFPRPETMRNAMSPSYPYNVFRTAHWPRAVNGGPYVILHTTTQNFYWDYLGQLMSINNGNLFRAVSLLADTMPSWNPDGLNTYGWPDNEFSLGPPLGPAVIDGDNYSREFRYGRIDLFMDSGAHPDPFDYTIRVNGRIVEQWARPYHFP